MLKYKFDKNNVSLDAECSDKGLVIGSVLMIGSIYVTMKKQSPQDAEAYRAAVRSLLNDDGAVIWEDTDGESVCMLLPCDEEE